MHLSLADSLQYVTAQAKGAETRRGGPTEAVSPVISARSFPLRTAGGTIRPMSADGTAAGTLITFAAGATLQRESDRASDLPIHRNGPPGTFVILPGVRVSLPTDQIVFVEERDGLVAVGFGGFRFDGLRDGQLTFTRVRELRPEQELSPDRSFTMRLQPEWVAAIDVDGVRVWVRQS
jgi:hypothetical protein